MRVSKHVTAGLDALGKGSYEELFHHACLAADGTAQAVFSKEKSMGDRFRKCLRQYYWIMEPMFGGINFEYSVFDNVTIPKCPKPDLADVVWTFHRNRTAHGMGILNRYSLIISPPGSGHQMMVAKNWLKFPVTLCFALLAVAVFAKANENEKSAGDYFLSLAGKNFLISEWWGREDDFRPIAAKNNQIRVAIAPKGNWEEWDGTAPDEYVIIGKDASPNDVSKILPPPDHTTGDEIS